MNLLGVILGFIKFIVYFMFTFNESFYIIEWKSNGNMQ